MAEIAIIIPVWRQPALVCEAILSVLAQENAGEFRIIVVNDGCDMPETSAVLEGWRATHPDIITLLTQSNKGLSAARNTGIDYALSNMRGLAGVFFLDADNRLEAGALALFAHLLDGPDKAGWFYPQFDMVGMQSNRNGGGGFSLSRLAFSNYCDAGSLVRAEVLQAGLRFDESLRSGYEDWDFWLGAAEKGYFGAPVDQVFLGYRKRPVSMLANAHLQGDLIFNQLKQKHKWLYEGHFLNNLWQAQYPRMRIIEGDYAPHIHDFLAWRARPFESDFPPVLVFSAAEYVQKLDDFKMLHSTFYQLEGALRATPLVGLFAQKSDGQGLVHAGSKFDGTGTMLEDCGIIAISRHHIDEALKCDGLIEMITYLIGDVLVSKYRFSLPDDLGISQSPLADLVDFVSELAESPMARMGKKQLENWRPPAEIIWPNAIGEQIRRHNLNGRPAMQPRRKGRHIGFAVPIFQFGGVEKCVVALARELARSGEHCHLFIYGIEEATAATWMFEPFESVTILTDARLRDWRGAVYLGTTGATRPDDRLFGDILGPLTQMDAVVNCGTGMLHHGAAALRSKGVKTVSWEHLFEKTPYGRSFGTPFVALAHEAGYDHIVTCSEMLLHQLAGHGVPRAKLLALPNGPGFLAEPARRDMPVSTLKIGFLGRFDRQKGVDRFIEIAKMMRDQGFDFSICGGGDFGGALNFPDWLAVAPPLLSPEALSGFFATIDILVLPSRDEGLPLTILEAQRAGVVCLCSDVGAVSEAIISEDNGILLPQDRVIESAIHWLMRLNDDRGLLHEIAKNAAGKPDNWPQNAARFVKAVFE